MSESTKSGLLILQDVRVPDNVEPGAAFDVEALVRNKAYGIFPWDPDLCQTGGYEIEVVFEGPGGQSVVKGPTCHGTTEIGSKDKTYSATFTAPNSGRARVECYVRLPGSGKRTQEVTASAAVTEYSPDQPTDPGESDGSDGSDGGWPGDDGDGDGPNIEGSAKWVAVAFIALALAWGADSAEGIVS